MLLARSDAAKDAEILVLRHGAAPNQSAPDVDRPGVSHRLGQAAAHPAPPAPAGLTATLLRWHAQLVARRWNYPRRNRADHPSHNRSGR
jgi:putative transposase